MPFWLQMEEQLSVVIVSKLI